MSEGLEFLARRLDYEFNDRGLLERALTHRSVGSRNNERLEFLGDAILGLVIARRLYELFPESTEGELSRLRASLVKGETLAELARGLDLGNHLRLGSGELKSGGFRRASILSDALEAIFGAILLDGGFEACRDHILSLYQQRLESLPRKGMLKDPKTRLQEYLQSRRLELPEYSVSDVSGQAHAQTFHVLCRIPGIERTATGKGSSRRRAEQDAAETMLDGMQVE